jgi:ribosomal protein L11 methyltransferase
MSGIIDTREQDVLDVVEKKFNIISRKTEKGWVALAATLK